MEAIVVPDAAESGGQQRQFLRSSGLNFLRFASVLVGAGLLLRVGASEQANSAIEEETAPSQKPAGGRITLPEPAFGGPVKNAAMDKVAPSLAAIATVDAAKAIAPGKADSLRIDAPTPAFAAAFATVADPERPAKDSSDRANGAPTKPAGASDIALAVDAAPALASAPRATSMAAKVPALARTSAATGTADALSFTGRRSVADGLLAPVKAVATSNGLLAPLRTAPSATPLAVASQPAKAAPLAVAAQPIKVAALAATPKLIKAPPSAVAAQPAKAAPLAGVQSLAIAKPQAAAPSVKPAVVAASNSQTAPIISSRSLASAKPRQALPAVSATIQAAPAAAARPVSEQPVRISLAPPVMTPGPRTTVTTSNLSDEMRRPASAWDYAEALPPELTGVAAANARRSAVAEPVDMPAPAYGQTQQNEAAPRQIAATPAPRKIAASAGVKKQPPVLAKPAAPARVQAKPATADTAKAGQTADLQHGIAAPPLSGKRIAILDAGRMPETRASSGKRIFLHDEDRQAMAAADTAEDQAPLFGTDAERQIDEASSGETTTLSLRDRIPHPAF